MIDDGRVKDNQGKKGKNMLIAEISIVTGYAVAIIGMMIAYLDKG